MERDGGRVSGDDSGENGTVKDNAGVVARPPLIYLLSIFIGSGLKYLLPLEVFPEIAEMPVGCALIVVAVVLFILSIREFRVAGTAIPTHRPTTTIVKSGPYGISRNPIYLAFSLFHLGIAIWVNTAWLLVTLVVTFFIISNGVIAREERYLARRFGEEYLQYKSAVRRWL